MLSWRRVHQPKVCSVMVFHGSIVDCRRGGCQPVMKIIWCNGLPQIHARLEGGPSDKNIQCNGLPWICGQLEEGGPGSVCHENCSV